ncbi:MULTISPECIES: daunorubicin resistance protein DrrA family ABC transporter ATP-binding protein [unclassified Thioalkalivibrio]|uniref:daunorubicin resistance protein DrrA family ABC transporter ATP-binding protein n=1 Tax=unclassified Thioalkalivibrio TaxID=2621013 RepID=UPI00037DF917|nr:MULTISPECIES: daunorubicin resistance protein DrrA family ABC transporter ATP-binding protein [unclassified Thioalkalivibrio]
MDNAIEVEGLVRAFGATRAVDGVDLRVPSGQVLGLLGPNGAGKTTVVRMLATLLAPTAGMARVGGLDVVREAARVREIIGLTGQYASVDEKLTGRENLILIGRLLGLKRRYARARADALLRDFDLREAAQRPAQTYSGGMRRRLDLAASLVGRPRILFLDEPSTGLDPRARRDLWERVRQLQAGGTTVLLTTQYLEEADALADAIVVLDQGHVIAEGTAAELKARVGGRTLFLVVARTEQAVAAGNRVAGIVGTQPQVDGDSISVPVSDPSLLPAVLRDLDSAGIEVAELGLRGASLDDVFLSLTGRSGASRAEPGEEEDAA